MLLPPAQRDAAGALWDSGGEHGVTGVFYRRGLRRAVAASVSAWAAAAAASQQPPGSHAHALITETPPSTPSRIVPFPTHPPYPHPPTHTHPQTTLYWEGTIGTTEDVRNVRLHVVEQLRNLSGR